MEIVLIAAHQNAEAAVLPIVLVDVRLYVLAVMENVAQVVLIHVLVVQVTVKDVPVVLDRVL